MTRPSKSPQESGKPPRAAVAACALAGLCALLLMAAAVVLGPPPAEGFASEREAAVLASPAGWLLDRAVHMRIALVAFSLWGVTAWLRCPDAEVRHLLAAVAGLLALWMALVIVKWKVADIGLGTLLWYAYYIPMALLPVSCAAIGARTAGLASRPPVRRALRAALAVSCALALLALTNNRHQAFFLFDEPTPGMIGDYTYGWAHAVFLVWSVLCYAAFFASLVYAARRRLRLMLAPVVGVALLGIAYCVAYVLRFEAILGLNFSLTYALVLVCALELSLDLGLIPSTVFLSRTFDALPLDLAIVSREGETFRATRAARGLSGATRGVLASSAPRSLSWSEPDDADTRHHAWPISGGWAHLAQDVSGLNRVRGSLAARSSELARRNAMLENERQISQATSSLMAEERLVDEVEAALSVSLARVADILSSLPAKKDAPPAVRRKELERVRTLIAYCKRKGSLVLAEQADPELDCDRIRLIASELAGDLRAVGIDCAAVVDLAHPLPAQEMSVIYDCIYDFAFVAFESEDPVLMYHLGERDDGTCELRALLQTADEEDLAATDRARELKSLLSRRDTLFSVSGEEGSLRLVLRVRSGGERP